MNLVSTCVPSSGLRTRLAVSCLPPTGWDHRSGVRLCTKPWLAPMQTSEIRMRSPFLSSFPTVRQLTSREVASPRQRRGFRPLFFGSGTTLWTTSRSIRPAMLSRAMEHVKRWRIFFAPFPSRSGAIRPSIFRDPERQSSTGASVPTVAPVSFSTFSGYTNGGIVPRSKPLGSGSEGLQRGILSKHISLLAIINPLIIQLNPVNLFRKFTSNPLKPYA